MDSDFKVMHVKIINCMGITHISIVTVHFHVYFSHALSEKKYEFRINKSIGYTNLKLSVMLASCFPVKSKMFGIFPIMHISK